MKLLERLNAEIERLEAELAALNQQYETAMRERQLLQEMLDQAERRLVGESHGGIGVDCATHSSARPTPLFFLFLLHLAAAFYENID